MRVLKLGFGWYIKIAEFAELDADLKKLVLSLEDRRFYRHSGVDCVSLLRAVLWRVAGQKRGGASTIHMQMVRTITNDREMTYARKVREIFRSMLMDKRYQKEVILNSYLSIAYFGEGNIGAEQAAETLFGGRLSDCSYSQKALVAAILLYPIPEFRSLEWWSKVHWRALLAKKVANKIKVN
ncbi:biosynthetic peptidoglycan transglycosylase [Novosphingobium sp.]|uniref:biosynthetic peptidoglycan transglycosylase n=1 Tax=Novosphingobium sp. TaxID=1874826 RepID=UPI003BA9A813